MAGGSAGYAFGPLLIISGFLAVIVVGVMGIASAVALQAMLSRRDPRSPFDRLMLILCLTLDRPPRTYLPSAQDEQGPDGTRPIGNNGTLIGDSEREGGQITPATVPMRPPRAGN
jgi:hypothetical protein